MLPFPISIYHHSETVNNQMLEGHHGQSLQVHLEQISVSSDQGKAEILQAYISFISELSILELAKSKQA